MELAYIRAGQIQEASYLKMCSTKLEPRNGSDQTTACISTKFGKSVSFKHTIRTIEAIFNIWPLSQDTGPLGGTPEGSKIVKNFFLIFHFFSVQAVELMSLPLQKRIGFPKFCLFLDFLRVSLVLVKISPSEPSHYRTDARWRIRVSVTLLQPRSPQSAETVNMRSVKHCHTLADHFGPFIMNIYHFIRHGQSMYTNAQLLTFYGKMWKFYH